MGGNLAVAPCLRCLVLGMLACIHSLHPSPLLQCRRAQILGVPSRVEALWDCTVGPHEGPGHRSLSTPLPVFYFQ